MTENIVSLRPDKPFTPPAPPAEAAPFVPDENLVLLAQQMVDRVKSGEITALGIATISHGGIMSVFAVPSNITIPQLAVLNTSVDSLKDQVLGRINIHARYVDIDGDEYDPDEDGDDAS